MGFVLTSLCIDRVPVRGHEFTQIVCLFFKRTELAQLDGSKENERLRENDHTELVRHTERERESLS